MGGSRVALLFQVTPIPVTLPNKGARGERMVRLIYLACPKTNSSDPTSISYQAKKS